MSSQQIAGHDIALPDKGVLTVTASADHLERMLHKAVSDGFEMTSDEPEWMNGEENYPYPLHYFVAGVGLCLVTQIVWFGRMRKVDVQDVHVDASMHWSRTGSGKRGDLATVAHALELDVHVTSDAPAEDIEELVRIAEAGCYARTAIEQPVPIVGRVVLNEQELSVTPKR